MKWNGKGIEMEWKKDEVWYCQIVLEMERNGKGDGNKKKVRYVMKRNNRKEIECRVKFQEKENVAAI